MSSERFNADASVDQFIIGIEGRILGFASTSDNEVRDCFDSLNSPLIETEQLAARNLLVNISLISETDEHAGRLSINFYFSEDGKDLVITSRTSIRGNAIIAHRAFLGAVNCGSPAFDGKVNVLGDCHRGPAIVQQNTAIVGETVQYVIDVFHLAFGGRIQINAMWLKAIEATRDIVVPDARAAMRVIQQTTMAGAIGSWLDRYKRVQIVEDDSDVSLRYKLGSTKPELKAYAKRDHTLRLEVRSPDRGRVASLTARRRLAFTGSGASALCLDFLNAAAPLLDQLEQHVAEVLATGNLASRLIVSLQPLVNAAAGEKRNKGPTSEPLKEAACRALDGLITTGIFNAVGHHRNHAIRRRLDALCEGDGPLERHVRRAIYYVRPKYAAATFAGRRSAG